MGSEGVFDQVYALVRRVPKGRVATYGQIAQMLGNPRLSRAVGYALHVNPTPPQGQSEGQGEIPCHRIVNRHGGLAPAFAFGGIQRQKLLLEAEGILFEGETVDLAKYQWRPEGDTTQGRG